MSFRKPSSKQRQKVELSKTATITSFFAKRAKRGEVYGQLFITHGCSPHGFELQNVDRKDRVA